MDLYDPFGMPMIERSRPGYEYRFGFNGKQSEMDFREKGRILDYGMRTYDTRLGRFLSVDPLTKEYPWNSTYAYAENDVVRSIDLDGLEKFIINTDLRINPSTKQVESHRHLFINPNKFQHDKGLIGHFDENNKMTIVNDPNELSDFDKRVFDYSIETMQQKNTSGASIRMPSSVDIKLKTTETKNQVFNDKPPPKVNKPIAEEAEYNSGIYMIPNGIGTPDRNNYAANQIIKPAVDRVINAVLSKSKQINSINLSIVITTNSLNKKNIEAIKTQVQILYPKAKVNLKLDPNYKLKPDHEGHRPSGEDFGYKIEVSGRKK